MHFVELPGVNKLAYSMYDNDARFLDIIFSECMQNTEYKAKWLLITNSPQSLTVTLTYWLEAEIQQISVFFLKITFKCLANYSQCQFHWQMMHVFYWTTTDRKLKEVYLYSAFTVVPHTQGAQVWITECYLQITPYLPLPRKHSPDGASPDWGCVYLITAYYSFIYPKGWKAEYASYRRRLGIFLYLWLSYTQQNTKLFN